MQKKKKRMHSSVNIRKNIKTQCKKTTTTYFYGKSWKNVYIKKYIIKKCVILACGINKIML